MRGEIGTLEQVLLSKIEPYNRCHLVIEFRRMTYVGTLVFDDVMFCHQLCELLQNQHLGKSIKEIGDLDVGRFLVGGGVPGLVCKCKIEDHKIFFSRCIAPPRSC
jgi:hypothetical protein